MIDGAFKVSTMNNGADASSRGCGMNVVVDQIGRDVVVNASGALDLKGLIYRLTGLAGNGVRASDCLYFVVGGDNVLVDLYEVPGTQLPSLGTGNHLTAPSYSEGDKFGFTNCNGATILYVARGYLPGSRFHARSVWKNTTVAALGLARTMRYATMGGNFANIEVGHDPADAGLWSWGKASRVGARF